MDRLIEAIEDKQNPSVVGLDPTEALVPKQVVASFAEEIAEQVEDPTEAPAAQLSVAFFEFNRAIIDAVADIVPAVKPQIAMYEALGPAGIDAYSMTCEYAKQQGLYVLGDVKRGDIGSTAAAYAHHLSGVNAGERAFDPWHEDAVTVNPYLGTDGITPFVEAATGADKDIFVLVRTSNPSSSELQELELASGERVYEHIAGLVEGWGAETIGANGYSRVGAVVGATHPEEGKALRARMPHTFFLVPGYGAQGGTAQGVAGMFDKDGMGALVNSSRGIIGAWKKSSKYSESMSADDALELGRRIGARGREGHARQSARGTAVSYQNNRTKHRKGSHDRRSNVHADRRPGEGSGILPQQAHGRNRRQPHAGRWRVPIDIPRRIHRGTCQAGAVRRRVFQQSEQTDAPPVRRGRSGWR